MQEELGPLEPDKSDPAFQPPTDPLKGRDVRETAQIINRELPLTTVQTGWTVPQVRGALESLVTGLFDAPAQLCDSMVGDSRVQSALASLTGGLFSRPIRFTIPPKYRKDEKAKACLDAWQRVWPNLGTESVLSEFMQWDTLLAFALGQLLWDTTDPELWIPHLQPWHPRYVYYHWLYRRYVAITLDGQIAIEPGDGHWVLHTPHNPYRGWMRGAVRAVAPWWLARNYALRDWARYSERHGQPIIIAKTPAGADPIAIAAFRGGLQRLGQESVVQCPQSVDPKVGAYDLDFLEASDQAWQGFPGLIEQCNSEITLAFQGQNLTSEVKEGSLAAARVHGDVRQSVLSAKARAFERTIYQQITRPFAAINFGDPELAPRTSWDLDPYEDNVMAADTLTKFATAIFELRRGGFKVNNIEALSKSLGLHLALGSLEEVDPLTTAGAGGGAGASGGGAQAPTKALQKFALAVMARKSDSPITTAQVRTLARKCGLKVAA